MHETGMYVESQHILTKLYIYTYIFRSRRIFFNLTASKRDVGRINLVRYSEVTYFELDFKIKRDFTTNIGVSLHNKNYFQP